MLNAIALVIWLGFLVLLAVHPEHRSLLRLVILLVLMGINVTNLVLAVRGSKTE